jgi:beta-lactamase regulating signal transducer with metallopeptidase domain
MKTEQKYLLFWFSLLFFSSYYVFLIVVKFSSLPIQHLVRTCITGLTSLIHLSADMFPFVIFLLAGLGILAIGLKVFFSYIRTRIKITKLTKTKLKLMPIKMQPILFRHGIQQHEIAVVHSSRLFAYTIGIWSSKIVISSSLIRRLSAPELEAVILHERHHQQHSHALLFFIGEIVNSILFLLPIFNDILISMKLKFEGEADKAVITHQGTTQHLLASLQKITNTPVLNYYPGFAAYRLEDRVRLLRQRTNYVPKPSTHKFGISLFVALVSLAIIKMPVNADTSLNPQLGQKCQGTMACAETCPTAEKPTLPSSSSTSGNLQSSPAFSMSYNH